MVVKTSHARRADSGSSTLSATRESRHQHKRDRRDAWVSIGLQLLHQPSGSVVAPGDEKGKREIVEADKEGRHLPPAMPPLISGRVIFNSVPSGPHAEVERSPLD